MIKKLSTVALAGALVFVGAGATSAHEVQSGDTMYKIARQHDMSLKDLAVLNPHVKNIDLIYVGQNIKTNQNKVSRSYVASVPAETAPKPAVKVSGYSANEIDLLARLVRAEAQSEPFSGKVAVANVVLNRVASSQFPNTIQGVIYQAGQFSPVTNGSINRPADAESVEAVRQALNGTNHAGGALFFYNPHTASSRWLDSKPTLTAIGNHAFK